MDRGAWWASVHGVAKVGHYLVTKQQHLFSTWHILGIILNYIYIVIIWSWKYLTAFDTSITSFYKWGKWGTSYLDWEHRNWQSRTGTQASDFRPCSLTSVLYWPEYTWVHTYEACGPHSLEDKFFLRRITVYKATSCVCLSRNPCHIKWSWRSLDVQHQRTKVSIEYGDLCFTFKGEHIL